MLLYPFGIIYDNRRYSLSQSSELLYDRTRVFFRDFFGFFQTIDEFLELFLIYTAQDTLLYPFGIIYDHRRYNLLLFSFELL
jgi:hypothetical protein